MPVKIPLRATYDVSGNVATGLSEYQSNEYISTSFGGTGTDTYAQGEILVGNSSGSLAKNTIQGTAGQITVTTGGNTVTIGLDSSLGFNIATRNVVGTVKVPDIQAVVDFKTNISGGTNYSDATEVLTRGGATGSSGLVVDIITDSGEVCAATVLTSGTRYLAEDQITVTRGVSNLAAESPTPTAAWNLSTSYTGVSSVAEVCTGISTISDTTPTPTAAWETAQSHTSIQQTLSSGGGTGATFNITTDNSGNPNFSIRNVGNGYSLNEVLSFVDPGSTSETTTINVGTLLTEGGVSLGSGATFDIVTDSSGNPTFSINAAGTGYIKTDQIIISEPTGSLLNLSDLTPTVGEGTISAAWQVNSVYNGISQCATSGSGLGASFSATTDNNGNPTFILSNIGQGYKVGDTLTILDSIGSTATATLTVSCANDSYISNNWQISETYTAIVQTSTSGSGASATFDVTTDSSGFPTVAVNAGGSNYAVGDTVTITEPTAILTVYGTLPTPTAAWEANKSYTNVAQTSTTGSGTGATVNITTDGDGQPSFLLVSGGTGYANNEQVKFTDPGSTSETATLIVTSIIFQGISVLSVKTVNSGVISAITNTTPIKLSSATVTSLDTDALITVKTVADGGLYVDSYGNLNIAKLAGVSAGALFNTAGTIELITKLETDIAGRVQDIDKKTLIIKDGVTLVQNEDGTVQLQSDGLAVAMSIVFGG
jgi:hypothetical protein